jgi:hypothetical protein
MLLRSILKSSLLILFVLFLVSPVWADIFDSSGGSVSDDVYDATGWDGVTDTAPSKNSVRDKIEGLAGGHDAVTLAASADTILNLSTQEISLDNQNANDVFVGAATGGASTPTFRKLVDADIPDNITITETDPTVDTSAEIVATIGAGVYQPSDADLTTYAGITPSANAQTLLGETFAQMLASMGAQASGSDTTIIPYTFKSLFGGKLPVNMTVTKPMPATGTITAWRVVGDSQATIAFQVLKSTVAVPDVESFAEISGTEDPALSNAYQATDTSLTTWTASVARGDRVQVKITSATATNPADRVQVLLLLTET